MRSPTSSQGASVVWGFLYLSRCGESLDRIYEEGVVVGWLTSIRYGGKVLVTPKDKFEN